MELNIKNVSSRILLERTDNGVILFEIAEDNTVISKMVYETYYSDGILNFDTVGLLFSDILETLRIPSEEIETNRKIGIYITKLDPNKPGEENEEND